MKEQLALIQAQLKGAGKLFFLLNVAVFMFNYFILTDNRHTTFLVQHEDCTLQTMPRAAVEAYNQFKPE